VDPRKSIKVKVIEGPDFEPAESAPTTVFRFDPMTGKPLASCDRSGRGMGGWGEDRHDGVNGDLGDDTDGPEGVQSSRPRRGARACAVPTQSKPLADFTKPMPAAPAEANRVTADPELLELQAAASRLEILIASPTTAAFKVKVLQGRLQKVQNTIDAKGAAEAALNAKWVGVPAWKVAVLKKREAEQAAT
jgi:hypothetical protein